MKINDEFDEKSKCSSSPSENIFMSPENIIAIYTILSVLLKMKKQLGLEAMIEYMHHYLLILDKNNPKLRGAVVQALAAIKVGRIYRDACKKV